MKRWLFCAILLLHCLFFNLCSVWCEDYLAGGKQVLFTKRTEGYYLRWETGDYNHAIFKDKKGAARSFFADSRFEKILKPLKGKLVKITYDVEKTNIPEAGGEIEIDVLKIVTYNKKEYKP